VTDDRVALGHAIFALHEPHRGHEVAFNRWYERDHMYAAALFAPWTMAGQRWVATGRLKELRYPDRRPFGTPARSGSFLTTFWIQATRLQAQQEWVAAETARINPQPGRTFTERDVMTATTYDYVGAWSRDPDGVPPEQALDHRFPGLVWTIFERDPGTPLSAARDWLLEEHLPERFADSPVAMSLAFTPLPKADWWPKAAPEVPGVGDRLVLTHFLDTEPGECWSDCFASLGAGVDAAGHMRTLLVAPFLPTLPGTDRYCDELW
jgi:hypothetical protein